MDRINYAGDSILTGTAIAHALLAYAQALAEVGASATVEIPTVGEDGTIARTEILVGPASQVLSTSTPTDLPELVDASVVERLEASAARLRREQSVSSTAGTEDPQPNEQWTDYDL